VKKKGNIDVLFKISRLDVNRIVLAAHSLSKVGVMRKEEPYGNHNRLSSTQVNAVGCHCIPRRAGPQRELNRGRKRVRKAQGGRVGLIEKDVSEIQSPRLYLEHFRVEAPSPVLTCTRAPSRDASFFNLLVKKNIFLLPTSCAQGAVLKGQKKMYVSLFFSLTGSDVLLLLLAMLITWSAGDEAQVAAR